MGDTQNKKNAKPKPSCHKTVFEANHNTIKSTEWR